MPLQDDRAAALPPLRPAFFFCAVVPPWDELPSDPDVSPPRLDAPGELAILAARCLDMPLSLRASYCFSFFTFARLDGMTRSLLSRGVGPQGAAEMVPPGRPPFPSGVLGMSPWLMIPTISLPSITGRRRTFLSFTVPTPRAEAWNRRRGNPLCSLRHAVVAVDGGEPRHTHVDFCARPSFG